VKENRHDQKENRHDQQKVLKAEPEHEKAEQKYFENTGMAQCAQRITRRTVKVLAESTVSRQSECDLARGVYRPRQW